jgi:tetratricopeptide (TPR) repeat protein
MSAENVSLGLAVSNVLENMLTLHSDLEEVWAGWNLRELFPGVQDLHDWLRGNGVVPDGVDKLGFQYLVTGQVYFEGKGLYATIEFLDRSTDQRVVRVLVVDFPRLEMLRTGFLELLAQAGIPVPEIQKPKMLWEEDLSLAAFVLLGQGLHDTFAAILREINPSDFQLGPFIKSHQLSPRSYLFQNNLGWVVYLRQNYDEAMRIFERALALNPVGASSADGMLACVIATGHAELEETWTARKAQIQGLSVKQAFLRQYDKAREHYEAALTIAREVGDRVGEGSTLYSLCEVYASLNQYNKALQYCEAALTVRRDIQDRVGERATLSKLGLAYASLSQYGRAIEYYEQALAIHREVGDRAEEGTALGSLGGIYASLSQYGRAIKYLEQALVTFREVGDRAGEGKELANLGTAYGGLGQYGHEIEY